MSELVRRDYVCYVRNSNLVVSTLQGSRYASMVDKPGEESASIPLSLSPFLTVTVVAIAADPSRQSPQPEGPSEWPWRK